MIVKHCQRIILHVSEARLCQQSSDSDQRLMFKQCLISSLQLESLSQKIQYRIKHFLQFLLRHPFPHSFTIRGLALICWLFFNNISSNLENTKMSHKFGFYISCLIYEILLKQLFDTVQFEQQNIFHILHSNNTGAHNNCNCGACDIMSRYDIA